jgi:tagatose-1,6-bisphosphate aldolase non-catalytic subunit AgaZ/GatZ
MKMTKANGPRPKISEMTAEAVRASGQKVAEDIRAAAAQAGETYDLIKQEAEETAQAIVEATNAHADRIGDYIGMCAAASQSFKDHRATLANIPADNQSLPPANLSPDESNQAQKAVEVALRDFTSNNLAKDLAEK